MTSASPGAARTRRLVFFARVASPDVLERVEFYADDLRILRALGFDVHVATTFRALRKADAYYVWWWTWAIIPVLLARLVRAPVLIAGVFDEWKYPSRPWWHRLAIRLSLAGASANLFTSALEAESVGRWRGVRRGQHVRCVVDTDAYCPADAARQAFILSVASMDGGNATRKCVAESIQAIAIVRRAYPDVCLRIAGYQGSDTPALRQLVHDLSLTEHVEFLGVVSRQEKIALLQSCMLYLQPSRFEGFGLAILEAMSCGAPVLTSAVGAVPEVGADAVQYVDGSDPEGIAQGILALRSDTSGRSALGRRARARAVAQFSLQVRRQHLASLLATVATAR